MPHPSFCAGIEAGNDVTLFYDPLLAKLIAWGETREIAIQRMRRALRELVIVGLPTSQPFHLRVMDDAEFLKGDIDIKYLERAGARVLAAPARAGVDRSLAIAAAMMAEEQRGRTLGRPDGRTANELSPWVLESRRLGLRDRLE